MMAGNDSHTRLLLMDVLLAAS